MRFFISLAFVFFTRDVVADLYRWIDPETGSVKYSSYPPPWYGDAERERGAPKVDLIPPAGVPAPAATAPAVAPGPKPAPEALALLEQRFKSLLQSLAVLPATTDLSRGGAALQQQMEAYRAVTVELDRLDPRGAERRLAEAKPVLDRVLRGLLPAKPPAPPAAPAK